MKRIYLNLKRFDIPQEFGGINSIFPVRDWGSGIIRQIQKPLQEYPGNEVAFSVFLPEAHLISAEKALFKNTPIRLGCQCVHREDAVVGGLSGAIIESRTASIARSLGCTDTIIGSLDERRNMLALLKEGGAADYRAVNRVLNQEIKCALRAGLSVLYCIGESAAEQLNWQEALMQQLVAGLDGIAMNEVAIAYEPVWATEYGRKEPEKDHIQKIARFIRQITNGAPVIYGSGMHAGNAAMLAAVHELDGAMVSLTRSGNESGFYPDEFLEIVRIYMQHIPRR